MIFESFQWRVDLTIANVERIVVNDDFRSSAGHRLEFYLGAIQIGREYLATGVGVGDVTRVLAERAESERYES